MILTAFFTIQTVLHRLNCQKASIQQDSSQFFKVMENTLVNTGTDSLKMTWIELLLRVTYIAIMHPFSFGPDALAADSGQWCYGIFLQFFLVK